MQDLSRGDSGSEANGFVVGKKELGALVPTDDDVGGKERVPLDAVAPGGHPDLLAWASLIRISARDVLVGRRETDRQLLEHAERPAVGLKETDEDTT